MILDLWLKMRTNRLLIINQESEIRNKYNRILNFKLLISNGIPIRCNNHSNPQRYWLREDHQQHLWVGGIMSKRANQISAEIKEELNSKLEEFNVVTDSLEEIFENREQIELSKQYERLPKPTIIATKEFLDGKIYFRNPAKEK